MFSSLSLLDLHERSHRSLSTLMRHCSELSDEESNRELPGFGYPNVKLQLHHAIGAERYWLGILQGQVDASDDSDKYSSVAALEGLRVEVFELTKGYLDAISESDLNDAKPMMTWGEREQVLVPAQVILRTQTHHFHHQGQVAAMCRILGKPSPGADFPLD